MFKDYRLLLVLAFVGFVVFAISLIKEANPEFASYQKAYYKQLGIDDFSVEIKQVNVKTPNGIMVDRCQSCHVGASNPDAAKFEQPLAIHPRIVQGTAKDPHDFGKIGCVVCHDGNGRALKEHDAHGEYHGWTAPLLAGQTAQANCNRCHAMESGTLAGAELYEKGRELFLEKACWGCHTIAGISSTSQAPELTNAGGKFPYAYLEESILVPSANIPNSKMPTFGWINDKETVAALATYLKGQQTERLRSAESTPIGYLPPKSEEVVITEASAEVGRSLFAGIPVNGGLAKGGCINCHSFRNSDGVLAGGSIGPDLTWSARARGTQYVHDHIRNSRMHVADSVMPIFKDFTDIEVESLVEYLSTFTYKLDSTDGKQLFDTYCVACHGDKLDGNGRVARMLDPLPRAFTPHFVGSYATRFKESIREGVKGTAMPTWKNVLSDQEIDTLINYIKTTSLKNSEQFERLNVKLPVPGDLERLDHKNLGIKLIAGDPAKGNEAFQKYCTACHGKLANGKGPNAYFLVHPLPRNLLNKEFMNQPEVTDERLYQSILLGVAGTPMPANDYLK
ncbi:MAG: c-type cytochrome, partial [Kiritimatiellales bacterium]|nr:c-type cytochrome [Kiritimatiellales bacterium]